jgi:hypothetical protein
MTSPDFAELRIKLCEFDYCDDKQHTKSAAIITELLETIQSQSEALEHVNDFCLCKRNTFGFDYHEEHPVQGLPESGSRWLTPRDRIKQSLSETKTRLQKLMEGK